MSFSRRVVQSLRCVVSCHSVVACVTSLSHSVVQLPSRSVVSLLVMSFSRRVVRSLRCVSLRSVTVSFVRWLRCVSFRSVTVSFSHCVACHFVHSSCHVVRFSRRVIPSFCRFLCRSVAVLFGCHVVRSLR